MTRHFANPERQLSVGSNLRKKLLLTIITILRAKQCAGFYRDLTLKSCLVFDDFRFNLLTIIYSKMPAVYDT